MHIVNVKLATCARRKYKNIRVYEMQAIRWLHEISARRPGLFAHWSLTTKTKHMMKQLLLIILLIVSIHSIAQVDFDKRKINWMNDLTWEQIKAKAKAEKKYILVDCFATWCIPCKTMDEKVFSDQNTISLINREFISVKVQMDETEKDNEIIKRWYSGARKMKKQFNVRGFPTFLFFSSDGKLLHKGEGFKNIKDFQGLMSIAKNPENQLFYSIYENFRRGKKISNYEKLREAALFAKRYINKDTAIQMAKVWKEKCLDKMSDDTAFSKMNLWYVTYYFPELMKLGDRYFNLIYNDIERFASIVQANGIDGNEICQRLILSGEIDNKLIKDGKGLVKYPDWEQLKRNIEQKYNKISASKIQRWLINYKIEYYANKHIDWRLWADAKDEKLKLYPPTPVSFFKKGTNEHIVLELNDGGAWNAFLHCTDSIVLERALRWITILLQFDSRWVSHIDTKANLLYKLGRVEEAIQWQQRAIEIDKELRAESKIAIQGDDELQVVLDKMKKLEPTYLPAAIWDDSALKRIKHAN